MPNLHDTTAFRYNVLVHGFDTSLIAGHDRGGDTFGGVTFTRVVGQAWEVHGEAVWREQAAALLGAKCTLHSGVTFIGEFYTPPNIPLVSRSWVCRRWRGGSTMAFSMWARARLRERPGWKEWEFVGLDCGESRRSELYRRGRRESLVRQSFLFVSAHGDSAGEQDIGLRRGAVCNGDIVGSAIPAMTGKSPNPNRDRAAARRRKALSSGNDFPEGHLVRTRRSPSWSSSLYRCSNIRGSLKLAANFSRRSSIRRVSAFLRRS